MTIDEVVYTRESLKRHLQEMVDALDKAGESYDPSGEAPIEDIVVVAMTMGLVASVTAYRDALMAHITAAKELNSR
jgi:hypothetical protein